MRSRFAAPPCKSAACFVLALALVLVAGQVADSSHYLLVKHSTCPEHGEIVHGAEAAHGAVAGVEGQTPATPADSDSNDVEGHGHCASSTLRREQAKLGEPDLAAQVAIAPAGTALAEARAPLPPRTALFLLAPKNSPPV
jgi:hypothetical protein